MLQNNNDDVSHDNFVNDFKDMYDELKNT